MSQFWETDAGKHAAVAKSYMEGALTLSDAQAEKGRILFRPTLSLAGQGLELMLKACMYLNGKTPPTRGIAGHNIKEMWQEEVCEPVRGHVYANATAAVTEAVILRLRATPEPEDILSLIEEYVDALAELHGRGGSPLRYPSTSEQEGPRTPFLVRALWGSADDFVKRPSDFALQRFRGLS